MTLETLNLNEFVTVKRIADDELAPKLIEMGLYPGKRIQVIFKAPFGGPIAFDMEGYMLSLRAEEASLVEVD